MNDTRVDGGPRPQGFPFSGFPAVGRGTVIPNLFFSVVLPRLGEPGDLLAFLWAAKIVQEQRGEARFVTAQQILAEDGAERSFGLIGGALKGLECGLLHCVEAGALLGLDLLGPAGEERVYFVNNPASRRSVARARGGELVLRPQTVVRPIPVEERPDIFRLYEENIGTISPLIGERLLAAVEEYRWDWIVDAFREAVELNRRNWRYIERILQNWAQEGRDERVGTASYGPGQARGGSAFAARYG